MQVGAMYERQRGMEEGREGGREEGREIKHTHTTLCSFVCLSVCLSVLTFGLARKSVSSSLGSWEQVRTVERRMARNS